jgi:hypothetical protein
MSRMTLDTADRLPVGAIADLGDRCAIVDQVTPDPCPGQPARLRLDLLDIDSHLWEPPAWLQPGDIVHYMPPANDTDA